MRAERHNRRQNLTVMLLLLIGSLALAWVGGCAAGRQQLTKTGSTAREVAATQPAGKITDPWRDRADLIEAPPLAPTGALNLPAREVFELGNGLTVLAVPDRMLPVIEVALYVRAGSIDDPPGKVGLADFTAAMLRQGVRGMRADSISRAVDAEGVSLNLSSAYELSQISCSGRRKALKLCVDLVAKLAMTPTFPREEMAEVRQRLLASVRSVRDNPHALAAEHFHNLLYGDDHPAGRPLSARSVTSIERADLVQFHRQRYLPAASVLVVTGDFSLARLRRQLRQRFERWAARKPRSRWVSAVQQPKKGFELLLVDKPDLSQSFFALGHAGVSRTHPDRDALRLANYVLGGGGFSSRLMQTVRSRGGKTYGISSAFVAHQDDGHFVIRSFTRNEQIVATLGLVREQLERIRDEPPTAEEIAAAKGKIAGGFALAFPTPGDLAGALARARLRGLPETHVSELPLRVERNDPGRVAAVARKHIDPQRILGAVVGKADVVAPLLKAAGIPFERVSFGAPISAAERAAAAEGANASAKENQ